MSDQAIPEDAVLPCGCLLRCSIVDGIRTLTYVPCKETCVHYRAALGLAQETDTPVTKEVR